MVLAFVLLSELTKAWLLYLGLVFLFMVVYAPGGLAGLIMVNLRVIQRGAFSRLLGVYASLFVSSVLMLAGASALIEMIYHLQLNAATGVDLAFAGLVLHTDVTSTWLSAGGLLLAGVLIFEWSRKRFTEKWSQIQTELAQPAQAGEAV